MRIACAQPSQPMHLAENVMERLSAPPEQPPDPLHDAHVRCWSASDLHLEFAKVVVRVTQVRSWPQGALTAALYADAAPQQSYTLPADRPFSDEHAVVCCKMASALHLASAKLTVWAAKGAHCMHAALVVCASG